MPVFRRPISDIIWQMEDGYGCWADFEEREIYALERAWNDDEETVNMVHWPHHSFHLPLRMGGEAWMHGLGPFQINNTSGKWRRLRRVLKLSD
jgi:hypothetical protein